MTGPTGRAEFFSREAGDYLRELEPLLGEGTPPLEALVRLARSLRGAAMLAGPATFARAAGELEHIVRQIREGRIGWAEVAPRLRAVMGTFRRLATSAPMWDEVRDHEATSLATDLRRLAGGESEPTRAPVAPGDAAVRSYVAREAAIVAGALERAAREIRATEAIPQDRLGEIRRAMQSLRGIAALDDFPPSAELLEAVDAAAADLARCPAPHDGAATLLGDAASALATVARAIAQGDSPDPDLLDAARLADGLFTILAGERAAMPVVALLLEESGAVAPFGGHGEGPPPADPLELAGLGDSLRQASAALRSARSATARRLKTFALIGVLRTAPGALAHRPAGGFTARLLEALERDPFAEPVDPDRLADVLARAGELLSSSARGDLLALGRQLETISEELLATSAPVETPAMESTIVPIEDLLVEEPPVPIEWLAPDPVSPQPAERTALERSLATYSRLAKSGASVGPLDALMIEQPVVSEIVPIETLLYVEADVVPIATLLYRGRGALTRADEVRRELESALQAASSRIQRVEPLLRELLDLVPLALDDSN